MGLLGAKAPPERAERALDVLRVTVALLILIHGLFRLVAGGITPFGVWLESQGFPLGFGWALAVTLFAGFVKGAVGFAMPMILVSAFAILLPQHLALAGLILPTLVTHLSQALRQGTGPAKATALTYRRFLSAIWSSYS